MFNISWLAIVSTASAVLAPLIVACHLAAHFAWMGRGRREILLVAGVSIFGLLLDQSLFALGLFTINGAGALAPLWLSCLWPVLATTLGHAFSGLQQRPLLAATLGALGGAGSYYAGTRMTAVDFADPGSGLLIIALIWALLFPALALTARNVLEGNEHATGLA
jgi:hypothetical protein